MPKRTTFFFLSLVSLILASGALTAKPTLLLVHVEHKSTPTTVLQDTPYDYAIQFASDAEKRAVKEAFLFPRTHSSALTLKNRFVTEFLETTQKWVQKTNQSTAHSTTKTLTAYEPSTATSKKIAFVVRCKFKKTTAEQSMTVTATILSTTSYAPTYVKNLVKTAFPDQNLPSGGTVGIVAAGGLVLLGCTLIARGKTPPPDPKRRETPKPPDPAPQHFFAQCEERLAKIAELTPPGTIALDKASTTPESLRFSTTTDEDETRGWGRTLNFILRKTVVKDEHPSYYILYDDKLLNGEKKPNKLSDYRINTVDNFTTAMLTHLLVRKVEIGQALVHFEEQIKACEKFKDVDVMRWLDKEFYTTHPNSLYAALQHAKTHASNLQAFFPPTRLNRSFSASYST